jgi:hypothetical protein
VFNRQRQDLIPSLPSDALIYKRQYLNRGSEMTDFTNIDEVETEIAKLEKYIKFARSAGACIGISIVIYVSYFFNTLEYQMPLMLIAIFLCWALIFSSFYCQN